MQAQAGLNALLQGLDYGVEFLHCATSVLHRTTPCDNFNVSIVINLSSPVSLRLHGTWAIGGAQ